MPSPAPISIAFSCFRVFRCHRKAAGACVRLEAGRESTGDEGAAPNVHLFSRFDRSFHRPGLSHLGEAYVVETRHDGTREMQLGSFPGQCFQ